MKATDIITGVCWEDSSVSLMARVVDMLGAVVTQGLVTSLVRKIFDLGSDTPDTAISTTTLVVASTVYNTLQTDAAWDEDDIGYNFKDTMGPTLAPTGGHIYQIEYKVTYADGAIGWIVSTLTAKSVRSS